MIKVMDSWISPTRKASTRFAPKYYCNACARRMGKDSSERLYTILLDKEYVTLCNKCCHTLSRKLNKYLHHN